MNAVTRLDSPTHFWQGLWERFERLSLWRASLLAGFFAWGVTSFFYAPPFWMPLFGTEEAPARIVDFIALCANPFERDLNEPILAYRITTPMLAWILGLRGISGLVIQYASIPATLGLIFVAMAARTDRQIAFLATLGVALSFAIIYTNTKPGLPDSVTHLAVASLLLTRNRCFQIAMTVLGALNDERFVLAIPFLVLWNSNAPTLTLFLKAIWESCFWILPGLVIVVAIRYGLAHGYIGPGIPLPEVYRDIAGVASTQSGAPHDGWNAFWVNVIMAYRGLWLVFLFVFATPTHWAWRIAFFLSMILVVASSATVADVGRSIGFAFPAFLLAVIALSRSESIGRKLLPSLIVLTLLTPCFYAASGGSHLFGLDLQLQRPLLLSLLRTWTGWDVMDLFR